MRCYKSISVLSAIALIASLSMSAFAATVGGGAYRVQPSSWSSLSPDIDTIPATGATISIGIKPDSTIYGAATNYAKLKFYEVTTANVVVQKVAEIDFTAGTNAPAGVITTVPNESVVPLTPGNRIRGIVVQVGSGMTLPDGYLYVEIYD